MATIGTDEIMGMLGNATIGAPTNIDYSQYSSESIDDLINAVAGGGGIFQNIFGSLGDIASAVSPAIPAIAGSLLTSEAYDRLSDIGEQSILGTTVGGVRVPGAMEIAERGLAGSQFKPFTVTTPTGAMFTTRMGGQPSMGQPMAQPVGQPSMMLPPGMDEREAFRQGLLGQPVGDLLPRPVITSQRLQPLDRQTGVSPELLARLSDQLLQAPSSSQFAPPPGMPARPEMPEMQTADMVQFTDPVTGRQMSGSGTLQQYRRQLKDYYDNTPGAQQYYEGLERQEQRERFPSLFGAFQPERLPTQPTADGLQIGMELSPQEQAMQQQLFGGAGQFFGQAQMPTRTREQEIFERMRAAQRPEEERQRLALEERLAAQGRLGVSSAAYGGATPEMLAMATAQEEARTRSMLGAMQQAQAEQAQQAALGQQLLGASYLPQAQLLAATQPAQRMAELQQQAQLYGTGLFGETAMSGLESRMLLEQARANLLGGIGSNILAGMFTPQVTKSGTVIDPGGFGDLGGMFGGIVEGIGNIFGFGDD
jgi:hypothetical protein